MYIVAMTQISFGDADDLPVLEQGQVLLSQFVGHFLGFFFDFLVSHKPLPFGFELAYVFFGMLLVQRPR